MTRPAARSGAPVLPTTFATPESAVVAARAGNVTAHAVPTQRTRSRRAAVVAAPLGSIALAPARTAPGTVVCGQCASSALTHLQMTLTDGSPVIFVSCHDCEHKGWFAVDGTGASLSLESVIAGATKVR